MSQDLYRREDVLGVPRLRGLRLSVGEVWRRWRSARAARKLKAAIRIARIDAAIAELQPIIETTKGDEHAT